MRLLIKSKEYYGVSPNYINRKISNDGEEKRILDIFMKFDETAKVFHKEADGKYSYKGTVKERRDKLQKRTTKLNK